jgi:hypothetical protein
MNKLVLAMAVFFCIPALIYAQIDTNTVVYSWKLDDHFASRIRVDVDTLLDNYHNQNPVYRYFTSVSTLGNYSQPAFSNVFAERSHDQEYLLINPFYPFMQLYTGTRFFNTRTPFSRISYFRGGSNQNREEIFDAFHSQNLTKALNVGFHFNTTGTMGQYRFQKVKNNSFGVFSSYAGSLYSYHLSFSLNKIVADENGGITNDSLVTDTTFSFTKDIPTLFGGIDNPPQHVPDVYSEVRNLNLLAVQEIAFRMKRAKSDSVNTRKNRRIFYPKLLYILYLDRNIRLFRDNDPSVGLNAGLYPAVLFDDTRTADSLAVWKMGNSARLQFQGRKSNHYFVDYGYDLMQYAIEVPAAGPVDTLQEHWFISEEIRLPGVSYTNRLYNSHVSTGFNKVFANHLELDLFGQYYLTGYRSTDFYLSGDLKLFAGKPGKESSLLIRAVSELKTPDFLYTHYASNNFLWTFNFDKTSFNNLSIKLTILSKKFDIQGDYYLIRNFVYFNEDASPEQYPGGLSILSLTASKRFDFWKISSTSKMAYQKTNNEKILGLPEIAFYNSTYLKHLFNFRSTGGKLLTMIGFDLFYNTKYYADAYMPSLTTFYRQSEKQLGNYPYFDVFLNVQLKRLRFYIKYEHVNSGWIDKNYFSVLHYPRNERNLKFGLSWTFYD